MQYTITMTINIHTKADSLEQAQDIAQEMDIKFLHPETDEPMSNDIIDWEIKEAKA